jgi:hypothetical protein
MFDFDPSHDGTPRRAARPSDLMLLLVIVAILGIALLMIFQTWDALTEGKLSALWQCDQQDCETAAPD